MSDTPRSAPVTFTEFDSLSTEAWQERIRRDLKGADPASLQWHTPEGLVIEPFYHREALAALGQQLTPQVRHTPNAAPNAWRNVPTLRVAATDDGHAAVDFAAKALHSGADGIHFDLDAPERFDLGYMAANLPLSTAYLGFTVCRQPEEFTTRLLEATAGVQLHGFLRYAPGALSLPDDYALQVHGLRRCVQLTRHLPDFYTLALNGSFFNNRGASATQELACILGLAVAYLENFVAADLDVDAATVASAMHVHVSIGPSYFVEIAKLRALRRLWATLLHAYGLPTEVAAALRIHAATSSWTQTTLDPHTNMLRVTTEAMSAVLGGADSVSVTPYDSLYAAPSEFSARIARNVPIILREEAHLDRVADPAAGSYFIETLTDQLAQEAWAMFQETEAKGGFLQNRGRILEDIRKLALDKFHRIATGEQVIVGTNRFQNPNEQFDFDPKKLLRSRHFDTTRAAYPSEVLRLATAMHFVRKELQKKSAAVVLLGPDTIQFVHDLYTNLLPPDERPASNDLPPMGTLSVLFSSPDAATLMYANEAQFREFAQFIMKLDEENAPELELEAPLLLTADLATMQDAVKHFGFKEFTVHGHTTEDVLARLQGR
ncbi:methylmalonyl-CoA mutase family protein [Hymenobacter latericus]|uniref:methylmalonyl-CoA mutase family protein n=1 Tax=Hymenobacter sp. YIM 151858-1 TaxID=2987688 RepID=UPI0022264EDD|nr:methylmalonyl-CoA mutase family protein [Hymenobacter sp. YIM 151858-1]UYZ59198.1 methylmalonyl-CoA mutase family protein [Hymenobacter sp. YIM 151858-1]